MDSVHASVHVSGLEFNTWCGRENVCFENDAVAVEQEALAGENVAERQLTGYCRCTPRAILDTGIEQ